MGKKPDRPQPIEHIGRERVRKAELDDRIARCRAKQPPQDPTGEHHHALAQLAERTGREVGELVDEWHERAACREYEGSATREEAERMATVDIEAAYAPAQGSFL